MSVKDLFSQYIISLQDSLCKAFEEEDGKAVFQEDLWSREEGGGGISRIMADGPVFEKAGVNTSAVFGKLPIAMQEAFGVGDSGFFACGLSLVIHPYNPYVPAVHANWRYFELYNQDKIRTDCWFGGGSDLTPCYIFAEDGQHFHRTLKHAMDMFGEDRYPAYKKLCDEYFVNKHRNNEARGIGGVFYDYLRPENEEDARSLLRFQQANGNAFLAAYLPIVTRRKNLSFGDKQKEWQEVRRGRYAEFNLIHDRGTLFGLKTNGRTESILMSLPPKVRWNYNYEPATGSREAELLDYLKPRDWVGDMNHSIR
ncbi:MAG: oxygen-dependent coproporphyrinogen oxidase [Chitinophagaceae bacterium]